MSVVSKYRIGGNPFERPATEQRLKVECACLSFADGFPRCSSIKGRIGKHPFCPFLNHQKRCEDFVKK